MPDDLQERLAKLEHRLKSEADEARAELDRADATFKEASANAYELGLNTVDGAHSLRQAAEAHAAATTAYGRAVGRFSNFLLHGKPPED